MSAGFQQSIEESLDYLLKLNQLKQAFNNKSLEVSKQYKKASLTEKSYKKIYDIAVENFDFNVMLNDGAFFQFTEFGEDKELRLAYHPSPYQYVEYAGHEKAALSLLESEDITLEEYEQLLIEEIFTYDIPPIRYDLSFSQYKEQTHPTAHMHVGFFSENRWPVRRVLNPFTFVLFILKTYYQNINIGMSSIEHDEIYRKEVHKTTILGSDYFTDVEKTRLHIT